MSLLALCLSVSMFAQTAVQENPTLEGIQSMEKDYVVLTKDNFSAEILEQEGVTVAYFWAVWCGPCRMTGPIIEELATEQKGEVVYGKLDVDSYPEVANDYSIRSIPTMLFFKDGELVEKHVGTISKKQLKKLIEEL